MAYEKTQWRNGQAPAINAANLNKIEDGIATIREQADMPFCIEVRTDHPTTHTVGRMYLIIPNN